MLKKGDFIWISVLAAIVAFLIVPDTHEIFIIQTKAHPYIIGFIKFFILASMGDLLGIRISKGRWEKPTGFIYRSIIWGFIGMAITLVFVINDVGITQALEVGLLPGNGNKLAFAFFVSLITNLTFGPAMMAFHRFTDTYIDLTYSKRKRPQISEVIDNMNFNNFIFFVIGKTIPFFWIPAHTITFLLPPVYRVLMAAFLGIALGCILSFSKRKK